MHRYTLFLLAFSTIIAVVGSGIVVKRMRNVPIASEPLVEEYTPIHDTPAVAPISNSKTLIGKSAFKPRLSATPDFTKRVVRSVPFTSQAPLAQWKDDRHQDGCEEASVLMVMRWVQGKSITPVDATSAIESIAAFEEKNYGTYHDTSAQDTLSRIINGYFHYTKATVKIGIGPKDIRDALYAGYVVIVPMNGQKLGNPNFTGAGPQTHMLSIIGYDPASDEFITNDPGTRKGAGYRYAAAAIERSLLNYPTGRHEPLTGSEGTAMIVVSK